MKVFILSTLLLGCYIVADVCLNRFLWDANTKFTIFLQNHSFQNEKIFMNIFSDYLDIFPGIALIVFLTQNNKLDTLLYGGVLMFIMSLSAILKNIYHQARPFWIEDQIIGQQCGKEFGKPSGHAMSSIARIILLTWILFPGIWKNQSTIKSYPIIIRVVVIFCSISWIILTGLARVYFGVHTIGQIFIGWAYSLYIMVNYLTYFHNRFKTYIQERFSGKEIILTWKQVLISIVLMIIWGLISLLFYELNENEIWIDKNEINEWLSSLNEKCIGKPNYTIESASVLQNNCFTNSFQISFVLFLIIGAKLNNGTYNEGQFMNNFIKLKWYQKLIRILLLPLFLLLLEPFVFFINTESLIRVVWLQTLPFYLVGAFVITLLYPISLHLLKLDVEGDFLLIKKFSTNKISPTLQNSFGEIMNSDDRKKESPTSNQIIHFRMPSKQGQQYPEQDSFVLKDVENEKN